KNKGQDIKDLSQKIEETVAKHLEVLQENLQKVPEQAKKGIENAIENSQKQVEKITGKKDETSGWKTYRNEKYGFELKYPVNYNTEQPTPDTDVFIIRIPQKQEYLQIQVLNTKPPLAENYRPNSAQLIGEVMIGGKKAIKYYTENPLGEGTLSGYPFTNYTIVLGDNKWININYYGKGSMVESFERVLSTFKFIEKTDTADWKTYRNEKYGFEVKYPATWQNPTERDFATYPESGIKDAFAVEFYKNTVNGKGVNGEGFFMIISKRDDLGYRDLSSGAGLPLNSTFSDFKKCSTPVSGVAIGVENYPAKKVYISPTDKCFQTGYWYVFQDGKYSYNIRSRSDGFACVGCDGEPTTKEKFPEFYQILSNFKFVPQ
ncbi:MAG: hypothetical protein Q8N42_01060, partial [bacterium]|nr:hypothetical protein [bacterium]